MQNVLAEGAEKFEEEEATKNSFWFSLKIFICGSEFAVLSNFSSSRFFKKLLIHSFLIAEYDNHTEEGIDFLLERTLFSSSSEIIKTLFLLLRNF
jgi:hypothetical protein